jgi:hypothetical protein
MTRLLSPAGSARLPVLGHQGSVGRLHRQAVADLDLSMAVDGSGPEAAALLEDGESRMRGLASGHGATEESNDD